MPQASKKSPLKPIKRLVRPLQGRKLAGVAMAFANYLEIDVVVVRVLLVLLLLPWFMPGIVFYLLCWLIIPDQE
jgi:phage shock protein PspC (stress-responsive transcriptional regulator)